MTMEEYQSIAKPHPMSWLCDTPMSEARCRCCEEITMGINHHSVAKLVSQFAAKEEKDDLSKLFIFDNYMWATNGHMAIRALLKGTTHNGEFLYVSDFLKGEDWRKVDENDRMPENLRKIFNANINRQDGMLARIDNFLEKAKDLLEGFYFCFVAEKRDRWSSISSDMMMVSNEGRKQSYLIGDVKDLEGRFWIDADYLMLALQTIAKCEGKEIPPLILRKGSECDPLVIQTNRMDILIMPLMDKCMGEVNSVEVDRETAIIDWSRLQKASKDQPKKLALYSPNRSVGYHFWKVGMETTRVSGLHNFTGEYVSTTILVRKALAIARKETTKTLIISVWGGGWTINGIKVKRIY